MPIGCQGGNSRLNALFVITNVDNKQVRSDRDFSAFVLVLLVLLVLAFDYV